MMNKKERDNRANQLNPNNKAYWSSRSGNQAKSSSKSTHSSGSYRSSTYSGGDVGNTSNDVNFVSAPLISKITGRLPDNYAWVICNHRGEFLYDISLNMWVSSCSRALAFNKKSDAESAAQAASSNAYKYNGNQFYCIRCVKLSK